MLVPESSASTFVPASSVNALEGVDPAAFPEIPLAPLLMSAKPLLMPPPCEMSGTKVIPVRLATDHPRAKP